MTCFCFVALVIHLVLLYSLASASRHQYEQHHRFIRKSFQWEASLNNRTGVAASREESIFQQHPPQNDHHRQRKSESLCQAFVHKIFSDYPHFLERPSLTGGVCRLTTVSPPSQSQSQSLSVSSLECHLLQLLFKLPPALLTFGKPRCGSYRRRVFTLLPNIQLSISTPRWKEEMKHCIEIPILGGLLAYGDTPARDMMPTKTAIATKATKVTTTRQPVLEHGYLRFTWIEAQCPTNQRKNHRLRHQKHHQQQEQQQHFSHPEIRIITQIGGLYRPTLAGPTIPIPKWRQCMYCSTQRIFHAYVMWRFHGYVMKEYNMAPFLRREN